MEIMCSFEDVLYAGWEKKDFELRYIQKKEGWELNNYINYINNTKLCDMNFIDQYDPSDLSDDIYYDGIEVLKEIEKEKNNGSNDEDYIADNIGEAIIASVKAVFNKKG